MADEITCSLRRAEIAAILGDPEQKIPNKLELAERFGVDPRTIYRDFHSPELAELTKQAINTHIGAVGIAASYRLLLQAVLGQLPGLKIGERLANARWMCENVRLFDAVPEGTTGDNAGMLLLQRLCGVDPEKDAMKARIAELEERVGKINGKAPDETSPDL